MAVLTNADFIKIKHIVMSDTDARILFRSIGLDKGTWKTLFQTVENWFVNGFLSIPTISLKDEMNSIATLTNGESIQIIYVWMEWRKQ